MEVKPGYKRTEVGVIPDEWDVKQLRAFAIIATGFTPPTNDTSNYGDEFMFVSPVDLGATKYITKTEKRLSKKGFSISRRFPQNSVLFVCIGSTIGKCGVAPVELTSNQQINAIFPSASISPDFLYYSVSAAASRIGSLAGEQAVPLINKSQFSETLIALPQLPEQRAIAEALSDVDGLLGGLDRLIAKKRDLKQAAMQQLLTGQTRLPGFHGVWEVKSLTTVCSMKSGEGITSANIDGFSKYPCYGGNGIRGFTPRYTHDGGYALIGRQGALCGNVFSVEGQFFASEHAIVVTPSTETDIRWLTYVLGRMNLNQYSESSAQPGLSVSKLVILEVTIPPAKAEQTAIAAVLTDMDAELAALEQRREKTRALKQGMMQELLTGRTRLI